MKKVLLTQMKRTLMIACLTAGVGAFAQDAPIAFDATNVLNGSCTANWGSVSGATGYRIDVSTQPDFSAGVPTPWINEFKYNTTNENAVEFFEVVIPTNYSAGTNLTVTLYNASGSAYATSPMGEWATGVNAPAGHTVMYKEMDIEAFGTAYLGGMALSHIVGGETKVIQFISYGSYPITATDGPAAGMQSQQVPSPSILNHGSRLNGTGGRYLDFTWETGTVSKGLKNNNQTLTAALSYSAFVGPYNNYSCGNSTSVSINNLASGTKYYYRLRTENSASTSVNSNVIMFQTLAPHTWSNDTWTRNGVEVGPPTINDDVVLEDDYIFGASGDGTFAARSLALMSGSLTITSGNTLTVRRSISNYMSEAEFIVENNANIVQENGDAVNVGEITLKRNSNPLFKLDYTVWSSPVAGQNLQSFSPLTLANRFYTYNTANHAYTSTDVTEDFEVGKGYMIRMPNTWPTVAGYDEGTAPLVFPGEFKGVPHNGTYIVPVSSSNARINMVGNPYASPINVHAFFDQNIMNLDGGTPIWVWRKRNNPDATSYATITKAGYTANFAQGGDASNGQFNSNSSENWVLNPGQGFFVRVQENATGVIFTNGMRRGVSNNQFFRMDDQEDEQPIVSRLRLNIQGATEYQAAQAVVAYTDEATLGVDYGWDGAMFSAGSVALYTTIGEAKMAIQARPAFTAEDIVPLTYEAETAGNLTITLDQNTGVFENDEVTVILKDNTTGTMHQLKEGPYTFASEAGTFANRFEIIYTSTALGTENPVTNINDVAVYKQGNTININSGNLEMAGVTVYDIRGRVMYDNQSINASETSIDSLASSQQVLLVQISTVANGKVTKKIIF